MSYYFAKVLRTSFQEAVDRTKARLAERGFGVLTELDVASTLKAKLGVDLASYVILGACNPYFAHRALQAEPKIGTMLPCNVIVRQALPDQVEVAAIDPVASMQAIENPALGDVAREVQDLLRSTIADL